MKIFSIPDAGDFISLVKKSRGEVMLYLPDGSRLDLKQSHAAQQLFQVMSPGQPGLHIGLSNPADTPAFIQYMMEAGVSH